MRACGQGYASLKNIHIINEYAQINDRDKGTIPQRTNLVWGLPLSVFMKLKPTFKELSNEKLLRKCLHGLTQNQNESFQSNYLGPYSENTVCIAYPA